ncbi:VanZ family protein [Pontiellaceae bacterium B1224]|nr:VanZ family protein [Pontiellaceae bacterium B1224]
MKTLLFRLALVGYLLTIAYFGFRPFKPIPGRLYPKVEPSINGAFQMGAALEDRKGGDHLREVLRDSNQMSLEVLLKTDSLKQGGPARIISFSRDSMSRNFTLGQEGNGLAFRLRTSETDGNGMYPSLLVPQIFETNRFVHAVVVYDGTEIRLYIDGIQHPASVADQGDFSAWGKNHLLIMGDEVMGGRPWSGTIEHFSVYDRVLQEQEVRQLSMGAVLPGSVYAFPAAGTMRPLRYRNLFVLADTEFMLRDCIANVVAFIPLAPLFWLARGLRKCVFWQAVIAGFLISCSFEWLQQGIEGRVPCLVDLAYNMLGTLFGCGLLWLGFRFHRKCNPV